MNIKLNEKIISTNAQTVFALRDEHKPKADVIIINGFQVRQDVEIHENDAITLIQKGALPSNEELEYMLIARHTPQIHEKIKQAKVAIAGLGGLGSNIAMSLARMGIGTLKIVDYDVVEPSNLNRQNYTIAQIGELKTTATRANIEAVTTITKVIDECVLIEKDNIQQLFEGYDIIIEALDNANIKYTLITEALKINNTFIIGASGVAGVFDTELFTTKRIKDKCIIVGDFESEAQQGLGLMATRVSVAANIQANIAIRKIIGDI